MLYVFPVEHVQDIRALGGLPKTYTFLGTDKVYPEPPAFSCTQKKVFTKEGIQLFSAVASARM